MRRLGYIKGRCDKVKIRIGKGTCPEWRSERRWQWSERGDANCRGGGSC